MPLQGFSCFHDIESGDCVSEDSSSHYCKPSKATLLPAGSAAELTQTEILRGGKYSWKSRHLLQVILQLLQHGFQLWHFLFQVPRRVTATETHPQAVRHDRCVFFFSDRNFKRTSRNAASISLIQLFSFFNRCFTLKKRGNWYLEDFDTKTETKSQTCWTCTLPPHWQKQIKPKLWSGCVSWFGRRWKHRGEQRCWTVCCCPEDSPLLWVFQFAVCLVSCLGGISSFTVWVKKHEWHY